MRIYDRNKLNELDGNIENASCVITLAEFLSPCDDLVVQHRACPISMPTISNFTGSSATLFEIGVAP